MEFLLPPPVAAAAKGVALGLETLGFPTRVLDPGVHAEAARGPLQGAAENQHALIASGVVHLGLCGPIDLGHLRDLLVEAGKLGLVHAAALGRVELLL